MTNHKDILPDRPSPVVTRNGNEILDIHRYAPFLLNAVNGAWQRKTSGIYRTRFDLGIVDWRVLSMLMIEPRITANRVCEVIRLDKAAVSRSLKALHSRGFLDFEALPSDERKRTWWLTEEGMSVHRQILAIALECEAEMVAGVDSEDLETFLRVMTRFLSNLEAAEREK
ncbi:MarR family winged helix-turn-helix transcriptional regulator [Nioella aestuarii]|uniref:MarR family winged helix-turn-helix transcriptional regulator n=1 Tax=Nioella aestuarii TaxID=1662864 RepID=UPI003D7FE33D